MKMKTLLSAAHAAGYAMAPSEEHFHAPDGGVDRVVMAPEMIARQAALRASVPALPAPHGVELAQSWLKGVLGSVLTRRATA
ncbi:MAG: hypothetical protein KDJ18_00310 [Hyphomicrobiaceae bacterium]|nr:hypothetical protein [Hyphomicrobiaceae bacterium]